MLFTENQLQMQANPLNILNEAVYLSESEASIHPQMIPIVENSRLQSYIVNFNGIRRLSESAGCSYLDALVAVAESDGIDLDHIRVAIDEAELIENPELAEIGPIVVRPLQEIDEEYQFCLEALNAYIESGDEIYLDAITEESILNEFTIGELLGSKNVAKVNSAVGGSGSKPSASEPHLSADEIADKVGDLKDAHLKRVRERENKSNEGKLLDRLRVRAAAERLENWLNRKHGNETSFLQTAPDFTKKQKTFKNWARREREKEGDQPKPAEATGSKVDTIAKNVSSKFEEPQNGSSKSTAHSSSGSNSGKGDSRSVWDLIPSFSSSSGSSGSSGSTGSKVDTIAKNVSSKFEEPQNGSSQSIAHSSSGSSGSTGAGFGGSLGSKVSKAIGSLTGSKSSSAGNSGSSSGSSTSPTSAPSTSSGMGLGKKAAIGAGIAAAVGGGLLAYKQYKNRPKSVIAKRIAALRQTYAKFMKRAQNASDSGIKNKLKHVAGKILQVIDKLLAYLQKKAG